MDSLGASITRYGLDLFSTFASARLSILMFHRVHARTDRIFPSEPDATRFERLMRFVAGSFRVMRLSDALACLAKGDLPSRSLVITFDDGYADNAEVALPILQRLGLKASFFISTGFLDGGRMWNDSVIECVRACNKPEIDLESFGLGRFPMVSPGERRALIEMLLPKIKYLRMVEREAAIDALQQVCGVNNLPTNLMMREEQVRQLHRAGMDIGAHTVNHPILTTLTASEAEHEIVKGREQLQSIIDAPADMFAYPNGKPGRDYDYSHVSMVKNLGFRGAVSTAPGVSDSGDDLFQLPRFTPWGNSLLAWSTRLLLNQRNTKFDIVDQALSI